MSCDNNININTAQHAECYYIKGKKVNNCFRDTLAIMFFMQNFRVIGIISTARYNVNIH